MLEMMLTWETLHTFPPELNWPLPLPLSVGGSTLVMDWRVTEAATGPILFLGKESPLWIALRQASARRN